MLTVRHKFLHNDFNQIPERSVAFATKIVIFQFLVLSLQTIRCGDSCMTDIIEESSNPPLKKSKGRNVKLQASNFNVLLYFRLEINVLEVTRGLK